LTDTRLIFSVLLVLAVLVPVQSAFAADWYDSDWLKAKQITIDSSQVDSTLTDFPLLVNITDTDVSAVAQSDCDDILFTDSTNATKYAHEIENCDLTANDWFTAWVKIPSVSSSADTDIFMYYDNSGALSQEDVSNTWSNNFAGVWHLHDDFLDSTSNNNDGTNDGSTDTTGHIADGQDFDGINDRITLGSDSTLDDIFTGGGTFSIISHPIIGGTNSLAWTRGTVFEGHAVLFLDDMSGSSRIRFVQDFSTNTGAWDSTSRIINDDTTYIVTVTYDDGSGSNNPELWYNGNKLTISSGLTEISTPSGSRSSDALEGKQIGRDSDNIRQFDGWLDEARYSTVVRSDAWINAEYDNQKTGSTFITVGSEGTEPDSGTVINITDELGLEDSISVITSHTISITDELGLEDSIQVQSGNVIMLSDSIGLEDSIEIVTSRTISITDELGLEDSIQVSSMGGSISVSITDSLGMEDAVVAFTGDITLTDEIGLEDSIEVTVSNPIFNAIKLYLNSAKNGTLGGVFAGTCDYMNNYTMVGIYENGTINCKKLPWWN